MIYGEYFCLLNVHAVNSHLVRECGSTEYFLTWTDTTRHIRLGNNMQNTFITRSQTPIDFPQAKG